MSIQGIKTAQNKAMKERWNFVSPHEKTYIKTEQRLENIGRYSDYLFSIAPRNKNGAIDWEFFEKIDKKNFENLCDTLEEIEKLTKKRNRLYKKYSIDEKDMYSRYRQSQYSLSQSY
jgi:hypothetical protein